MIFAVSMVRRFDDFSKVVKSFSFINLLARADSNQDDIPKGSIQLSNFPTYADFRTIFYNFDALC
jgi:hypothetical protein